MGLQFLLRHPSRRRKIRIWHTPSVLDRISRICLSPEHFVLLVWVVAVVYKLYSTIIWHGHCWQLQSVLFWLFLSSGDGKAATEATPTITIKDYTVDVVTQFTYLASTTSNNGSLDVEIGKRIGKAATNMARLSTQVWENNKITTQIKIAVYRACIVSTLLYGSESWTTYAGQEKRQ